MFRVTCPNCQHANRAPQIVCEACHKILPFYTMNPFVIFQMTPSHPIDTTSLDTTYFNLQRLVHPDRVRNAGNKDWADQHSGQINQAYKALKNTLSIAKAAYLYIKNSSLPIEAFEGVELPTPEMDFLQHIIQLQASPNANDIQTLESRVREDLEQAVMVLNPSDIVQGVAKLTYIERLNTMK